MKALQFDGSSNTSTAAVFAQPLDKVSVGSTRIFDLTSTIINIILH